MGKITEVLDKYEHVMSELFTQENVETEVQAEKVLKKFKIKWDKKKPTQDGAIYLLKGVEVATYDDQANAVTVISGKRK